MRQTNLEVFTECSLLLPCVSLSVPSEWSYPLSGLFDPLQDLVSLNSCLPHHIYLTIPRSEP